MHSPFYKYGSKGSSIEVESSEDAIARGVKVEKVNNNSYKYKKSTKVDVQKLLNAAAGTPQEAEVIKYLKSMGFEVE